VDPTEFWQKNAAIVLIEFNLCGIGKTKTASLPFLLEARKVGAFGKEVLEGSV